MDLFPAWYQQKPVHSEAPQPVHDSLLQSLPTWTGFESFAGPLSQKESTHTNGLQAQQNQGEGPLGPESYRREDAGQALAPAESPPMPADGTPPSFDEVTL